MVGLKPEGALTWNLPPSVVSATPVRRILPKRFSGRGLALLLCALEAPREAWPVLIVESLSGLSRRPLGVVFATPDNP